MLLHSVEKVLSSCCNYIGIFLDAFGAALGGYNRLASFSEKRFQLLLDDTVDVDYASRPTDGIFETKTSCPLIAPMHEIPIQAIVVNKPMNKRAAKILGVMAT
jgi:hypothetical protein